MRINALINELLAYALEKGILEKRRIMLMQRIS